MAALIAGYLMYATPLAIAAKLCFYNIEGHTESMKNNCFFFIDLNGESPYLIPADPLLYNGFGSQILSHITSLMSNSLYHSKHILVPGGLALRDALGCVSKVAGSLILWVSSTSASNIRSKVAASNCAEPVKGRGNSLRRTPFIPSGKRHLPEFSFVSRSESTWLTPGLSDKIMKYSVWHFYKKIEKREALPKLALATAMVPPSDIDPIFLNMSSENSDEGACEVQLRLCASFSFPELNRKRRAIEPRTGIEFPTFLNNTKEEETKSSLSLEVLVGTGFKTMKIIKIKSLKVYAFGFYVHPFSVCEKLGPKYSSTSVAELKVSRDFYQDLLREDISMTIRLVVNCNGMKISSVKDAFEKSLRARLVKTNPEVDYNCLNTFGSYFKQDISLSMGTTIDFKRTADGRLVTEIEGNHIGAVCSKDLCMAFFDMYIGDAPISEQTKEEIGQNVAGIIGKC